MVELRYKVINPLFLLCLNQRRHTYEVVGYSWEKKRDYVQKKSYICRITYRINNNGSKNRQFRSEDTEYYL